MKYKIAVLLVTFSFSSPNYAAFDNCLDLDYFPNRTPPVVTSASQPRDLCMDSFAILHSGESKTPVYVVERLNRARLIDAQDEERTNKFYEEARLPSRERALLSDYKGSGFDRGHMAPAADMPTPNAMAQSFSLANMIPQAPDLNRGIWAKSVESATRKYAMRASGDVFVFTGAVFSQPVTTIGASQVWIPSHVYKLVYDADKNQAWAFWVENTNTAKMTKPINYAELVRRVGIEFLPGITPKARSGDAIVETVPVAVQETRSNSTSTGCGSKTTCKQMSDCAEARHYLTECGLSRLDRDGDGVPCEALCR